MSGVWKGIKKTFKKVVNVVKKIAPYVILAAAVYFTGGAALGGLAGPLGGAGAAGAAGGAAAGGITGGSLITSGALATTGSSIAGGSILGGLSAGSLLSGNTGILGALSSSGVLSSAIGGAAQAFMGAEEREDEQKEARKVVQRRQANFNIDSSSLFGVGSQASARLLSDQASVPSINLQGLGITTSNPVAGQPTQLAAATAPTGPPRPEVGNLKRYKYNPETGTIDFA